MMDTRLTNFYGKDDKDFSNIIAAQKERAIHIIMESIRNALRPIPKNLGRDFSYEDIIRCAWQNGWHTQKDVNEALSRLGLLETFKEIPQKVIDTRKPGEFNYGDYRNQS